MPDWLLPVVTLVFTVTTPFLAWWGSSRYFAGKFEQWQIHSEEWRHRTDRRLESIDQTIASGAWPAMAVRMQHVEEDMADLRKWKHLVVDPYIPRAVDEHERRLDKLESK